MKTLRETFTRENWEYTLIKQCDVACIYKMTRNGYSEYEVWKLRYHKRDNQLTGIKAGDVQTPSTKEWGRYGWSYQSLKLAEWKFGQLINEMTRTQLTENE